MAVTIRRLAPVAHLPLVLGVLRKLEVAQIIDTMMPPNPAYVLSWGRSAGVGHSRWASCPLQGRASPGRTRHVTPVAGGS